MLKRVTGIALCFATALCAGAALAEAPAAPAAQTTTPSGDGRMSPEPTFLIAKWKGKLYGFAEFDLLTSDSQSFNVEYQGNGAIAAPGTLTGDNGRTMFSVKNSRLGFALESPDYGGVKGYGLIEGDFYGFDPAPAYQTCAYTKAAGTAPASIACTNPPSSQPSESNFITSPTFRIRHAWVKIETPYLDIMAGQNWTLFGGANAYSPASVTLQGLPGQVYQRTPQLRLGKTMKLGGDASFDLQVAALRPFERDSQIPDLAAAVRFEYAGWSGYRTSGGTGSGNANLSLSVSGIYKYFRVPTAANANAGGKGSADTDFATTSGAAIAVDVLVPIIPAPGKADHTGALTFIAEGTKGSGYNDTFTGLNAGASVRNPALASLTGNYSTTLDPGAAGWDSTTGTFATVDYESLLMNLQYYLPVAEGKVFFSGVYSFLQSDNSSHFGPATSTLGDLKFFSAALFADVTPATRLGLEATYTRQHFYDNTMRSNAGLQYSMWFTF